MVTGRGYRALATGGTVAATVVAVAVANHPASQAVVTALTPLTAHTYANGELVNVVLTTLVVVVAAAWPLFKPQSRRIFSTVVLAEKRVFLAATALATVGYFDWTYRLPRPTLIASIALLGVLLPVWFAAIRRGPTTPSQAVLVGDDPTVLRTVLDSADVPVSGYVAPPSVRPDAESEPASAVANGGRDPLAALECFGGLSRLDAVLDAYDVDTVLLAFSRSDRNEFFGILASCYTHDVVAKVHRDHASSVLMSDVETGDLVSVTLAPWDWQDRIVKRAFDLLFATTALLVLAPVVLVIAVAIKLDSSGPVLYSHERTAEFGGTFRVYKFRSMVADAEDGTGAKLSAEDAGGVDPRVTRVGHVLRQTHLDEIPQLWSILTGDMSVVGPRPERPELDANIQRAVDEWQRRWFVRPGLTGLAQIQGATGHEPIRKLRYDVEYIRRQSLWFDVQIVAQQFALVFADVWALLTSTSTTER
ncbi:MAG: sugar transferase [Haloarculaceae archaeon]